MNQKSILTLARVHGGKLSASQKGMLLFTFTATHSAQTFADSTGGMLIKGMDAGTTLCAVRLSDAYAAGHTCRKCGVPITDMEYIASGIFCGVCPACVEYDLLKPLSPLPEVSTGCKCGGQDTRCCSPYSRFPEGKLAAETATKFNRRIS